VAGRLRGHAQPGVAGEGDDLGHVGFVSRYRHRHRALVNGEIPRLARAVPSLVGGADDDAFTAVA
jgi:hypothetical protein